MEEIPQSFYQLPPSPPPALRGGGSDVYYHSLRSSPSLPPPPLISSVVGNGGGSSGFPAAAPAVSTSITFGRQIQQEQEKYDELIMIPTMFPSNTRNDTAEQQERGGEPHQHSSGLGNQTAFDKFLQVMLTTAFFVAFFAMIRLSCIRQNSTHGGGSTMRPITPHSSARYYSSDPRSRQDQKRRRREYVSKELIVKHVIDVKTKEEKNKNKQQQQEQETTNKKSSPATKMETCDNRSTQEETTTTTTVNYEKNTLQDALEEVVDASDSTDISTTDDSTNIINNNDNTACVDRKGRELPPQTKVVGTSKNTFPNYYKQKSDIVLVCPSNVAEEEEVEFSSVPDDSTPINDDAGDIESGIRKMSKHSSSPPLPSTTSTTTSSNSDLPQTLQTCAICLTDYKIGDEICWSRNPECFHAFHYKCIEPWLVVSGHDECPVCRNDYIGIVGS